MFYDHNTITGADQDINYSSKNRSICPNRALLAIVMLGCAGVLSTPAFAAGPNAKAQKNRQETVNAYVQIKEQSKASGPTVIEKDKADYDRLASSVNALLQTFKRESEKAGIDNSAIIDKIESGSSEAAKLAKSGTYDKAHEILNNNYKTLTAEIVKLNDTHDQSSHGSSLDAAAVDKSVVPVTDTREYVEHALKTNAALLYALMRQNEARAGGKEGEIEAIKATVAEANTALEKGDVARAKELVSEANSHVKKVIIAYLQTTPDARSDHAATGATSHETSGAATAELAQESYTKRRNTIIALLDAGKRIDSEHGTSHANFAKAESMVNTADELAAEGKLAEGKAQLDNTYQLIRNEMLGMLDRKEGTK